MTENYIVQIIGGIITLGVGISGGGLLSAWWTGRNNLELALNERTELLMKRMQDRIDHLEARLLEAEKQNQAHVVEKILLEQRVGDLEKQLVRVEQSQTQELYRICLIRVDKMDIIQEASEGVYSMLGYYPSELKGQQMAMLFSPDVSDSQAILPAFKTILTKDNRKLPVFVCAENLSDNSGFMWTISRIPLVIQRDRLHE